MAADRGAFICQSQSLNLFVENANYGKNELNAFLLMGKRTKNWNVLPEK